MHTDGICTVFAAGYLKAGEKEVTAVEAEDTLFALHTVGFRPYAKPGGSEWIVNPPLTTDDHDEWTRKGVRWGSFRIKAGDFYLIPAGIPHQFSNVKPSLSVAWNLLPKSACDAMALRQLHYAVRFARSKLTVPCQYMEAIGDHAPLEVLVEPLLAKKQRAELERLSPFNKAYLNESLNKLLLSETAQFFKMETEIGEPSENLIEELWTVVDKHTTRATAPRAKGLKVLPYVCEAVSRRARIFDSTTFKAERNMLGDYNNTISGLAPSGHRTWCVNRLSDHSYVCSRWAGW